jgi:hypothetical protein
VTDRVLENQLRWLAFTIDDELRRVAMVGAFANFCRDTGTRMTFIVNGANSSWSVNAPAPRPVVDSGQIQRANHTWSLSHPDITRIGSVAVADQIRPNPDFLRNTYGVDRTAYFRVLRSTPRPAHCRPNW